MGLGGKGWGGSNRAGGGQLTSLPVCATWWTSPRKVSCGEEDRGEKRVLKQEKRRKGMWRRRSFLMFGGGKWITEGLGQRKHNINKNQQLAKQEK